MSKTGDFVHLHVHTDFSMLDGAAIPGPLVQAAKNLGMPAIAITDHGSMAGAYAMYQQARNAGIKPIIGIEGYLAPGDLSHKVHEGRYFADGGDDDVSSKGAYTHITMLAETTEGMHNLFKISTQSYLEGIFYKPRADRELLAEFSKGIIATTGCPSGEVQTLLRLGKYNEAVEAAAVYQSIFGKDNYYVEIMNHGLEIENRVISDLLKVAKQIGAPLVATNDLHYVHQHDAETHEALLCVQSGSRLNDPNRFKFTGDTYYLRPANEMRELFRDHQDACDNTLAIAERCHVEFDETANLMPRFPVPEGDTDVAYFKREVINGLALRFGGKENIPQEYKDRANYEGNIIINMGFPSYFLITADFINWAKTEGILVGPGRGSVGGSLIAWALGITELDPIRHGLLFERFLNPERVSMPDIDIDFDDSRRGEVIQYVINKYGDDRVAQIATFNIIKAKAAIKDSTRVLDYPYSLGDKMSKAFPEGVMGKTVSLTEAFDPEAKRYSDAADFRKLVESDRDAQKVMSLATGLEGIKRGFGMHAAGVIMSDKPLSETIPLMRSKKDGPVMTQFEYPQCEALGLIKMDFLGLSNLGTIGEAVRQIQRNRNVDIDIQSLIDTLDDAATYEMLSSGDTLGVFQLDSPPMRALLKSMKPDHFDDISAVLALYRPGPMGANAHNDYADRKNGRKLVTPIHPELAEPLADILNPTHGVIVFQEQVMAIAQKVAGYSLGAADMLRRAMGKKKKEILDKEYAGFHAGMKANGYSDAAITTLWEILVPFADYAFNKAHSAGYGLLSYVTGWLKTNFPTEYMAALLTTNSDDKKKTALYLSECRRMGIKVLPPSVNESEAGYAASGDDIRFGMAAIRNVGEHIVAHIVNEREESGNYTSFTNFLSRADTKTLNKRVVESLIKAGAFDEFGLTRRSLLTANEKGVNAAAAARKHASKGQASLFDEVDDIPSLMIDIPTMAEFDKRELLAFERDMLGLYVSDHPLRGKEDAMRKIAPTTIAEVLHEEGGDKKNVSIVGLITSLDVKNTRKGDKMCIATVEDLDASIEVILFPRAYQKNLSKLSQDAIVVIRGRIQEKDGGTVNIIAEEVITPSDSQLTSNKVAGGVLYDLHIKGEAYTPELMREIESVALSNKGSWPFEVFIHRNGRVEKHEFDSDIRVLISDTFGDALSEIIGEGLAKPINA
jgi:DNA polymerase-3 subunit alpha